MVHFPSISRLLALLVAAASVSMANNPLDEAYFGGDGKGAAMAAAPMYHFGRSWDRKPCYPEAAENGGVQTDGNDPGPDYCTNMSKGCADPGDWNGVNSPGNPFPVYYTVARCSDTEYRVGYSIYFKHDSGHKSDWENTIIVWKGDGSGLFWRDRAILGFHSGWTTLAWGDIQNTVDGDFDKFDQDGKNRDHPKVYQGFFYHATFHTRKTSLNTCANTGDEFRSNDWYFLPNEDWLHQGDAIKDEWQWGKADTNPSTLRNPSGDRWICSRG